MGVRALGAVPRDVHGDQPRVTGAQRRRVQPEAGGGALCEVLHEHVCAVEQPVQDREAARVLQVEGDRLLAAVAPHEVRGEALRGGVVGAGEVAAVGALDLDDPGAEVGELAGGEGGGYGLFDGDDGDSVEGQRLCGVRVRDHDSLPTCSDPALSPGGAPEPATAPAAPRVASPGRARTGAWPAGRTPAAGRATRRPTRPPDAPPARPRPPPPRRPRSRRAPVPPSRPR